MHLLWLAMLNHALITTLHYRLKSTIVISGVGKDQHLTILECVAQESVEEKRVPYLL